MDYQVREINLGCATSIGGGAPLVLIAGPCAIESKEHALSTANSLVEITQQLGIRLIYKSSYDKANRTSKESFRGVGLEKGLDILAAVKQQLNISLITDVHKVEEVSQAAAVVDILQIPAFLCRQTDLLVAAGQSGKAVMIKKGQFLHPSDMHYAAQKVTDTGNKNLLLCERGTCFGYRDLVVDFRGLLMMKEIGYPVVFDATHSVQQMGGAGGTSSGNREFIPALARAAVAVGADAVFLECHENPDLAPSDGANMLPLSEVRSLLKELIAIAKLRVG